MNILHINLRSTNIKQNKTRTNKTTTPIPSFKNKKDCLEKKSFYSKQNNDFKFEDALKLLQYESMASPVVISPLFYELYKYLTQQSHLSSFVLNFLDSHLCFMKNCTPVVKIKYCKEIQMFDDINSLCVAKLKKELSNNDFNNLLELFISQRV